MIVVLALLAFDPCAQLQTQEEPGAYRRCVEEWKDLLPRATEEMTKDPPPDEPGCHKQVAEWRAAAALDPTDHPSMRRRLDARFELENCRRDWLIEHLPPRERARRRAPGLVRAGAVLLGLFGAGFAAVGVAGGVTEAWRGNGMIVMTPPAVLTGGLAIVGAVLLGVGARDARP
jgi:hypothetical protein